MTVLALLALALWLLGATGVPRRRRAARRARPGGEPAQWRELARDAQLLRELAALLRSGLTTQAAVGALLAVRTQASPVRDALESLRVAHQLSGEPPQLQGPTAVRRLGWCLAVSYRSGAPLAAILEQLAEDVESQLLARQSFDAAMAGPRATSRLLTWLPVAGLGAGLLVGIDVPATLASSPAAQLSVLIGVALWLANRLWCRALLASTTRAALS